MAVSEVSICNQALSRVCVGKQIASLAESTEEAIACNLWYESCRDRVLEAFDWPFARRRADLALVADTERSGWEYVYALPSDCIAVRYIYPGTRTPTASTRIPYSIEWDATTAQRVLLCDEEEVELVYTARVTNVLAFSPKFVDALAWAIASEVAMPLQVDQSKLDRAVRYYGLALLDAEASQTRQSQDDAEADASYIAARA